MTFYSRALVHHQAAAWQEAVQALRQLSVPATLLLGFVPDAFFVREQALHSHVYVVGPSNSGKSSRVLAPLLAQLITAGRPVWMVDCKCDPLLFGHAKAAANAAGRRLRLFSLQPGVPSEVSLDFFAALRTANRTPRQIAELLVGSLGLNQAAEPFFISENSGALTQAIVRAGTKGRVSFRSIAHELRGIVGSDSRYQHAAHALNALEALADIDELNPKAGEGCDLVQLVEEGAVMYFLLPVSTEMKLTSAITTSLVMKLATVITKDLALAGRKSGRIYFCIDEFQDVAGASDLKDLIGQVRGAGGGISLILSHQVHEQVENEALRALLMSAGILILLAPRQFAQDLQEWSGEKAMWLRSEMRSWTTGFSANGASSSETESISYQQTLRPAMDLDLIQQVNGLPGFGIAVVEGGEPFPVFFPHHVPAHVARSLEANAFPRVQARPPTAVLESKSSKEPRKAPANLLLQSHGDPLPRLLQQLFDVLSPRTLCSRRAGSSK